MTEPSKFEVPKFDTVEVEFTIHQVDPALLAMLYGDPSEPSFTIEVFTPIKRKWWQWLLRRPQQYAITLIPNAQIERTTFIEPYGSSE